MRKRESEIETKLEQLYRNNVDDVNASEHAQQIRRLKDQLEEVRKPKIEGLLIRSKVAWNEGADRPTKYFLSLEKQHSARKNIAYIEKEGIKTTNPKEIIHIFTSHLGERYSHTSYGET